MAIGTPEGRSSRRTHLCGARPQAPTLHFRAPFKVSQGLPKSPCARFCPKLWALPPLSELAV